MNFLLSNHNSTQKVKIPDGLNELISDISREVLRTQPEEIYTFIADYLESMLITREHTYIAAKTVESLINCSMNVVDCMQILGIDLDRANKAATVIQNNFRKHLKMIHATGDCTFSNIRDLNTIEELLELGIIQSNEAKSCLNIIYTAFKSFYYQQTNADNLIKTSTTRKWLDCIENTLKIYRMSKPSREKMERAAVAVQAAYKGYYVRRYKRALSELRKYSDILILEGKLPQNVINNEITKPNLDSILSSIMNEIKSKSEAEYVADENLNDIVEWVLQQLGDSPDKKKSDKSDEEPICEKIIDKGTPLIAVSGKVKGLFDNLKEAREHLSKVIKSVSKSKEYAAQVIQRAYRKYMEKKKSKKDVTVVSSIPDSDVSIFERDEEIEVQTNTLSQNIPNVNLVVPPAPCPSAENLFSETQQ